MQPFQNEPEVREAIEKVKGYLNDRAWRPLLDQKIEAHWASKDHGR